MRNLKLLTLSFTSALLIPLSAFSFFSTVDTGEILEKKKYKVLFEPQYMLNLDSGFNLRAHIEQSFGESSQIRLSAGTGTTSLLLAAKYKWIPIPDTSEQPAMGFIANLQYSEINEFNSLILQTGGIASKKFNTEYGVLIPYSSLNFAIVTNSEYSGSPMQLAVGTSFKALQWTDIELFAEYGMNITNSFNYITVAISYEFSDAQFSEAKSSWTENENEIIEESNSDSLNEKDNSNDKNESIDNSESSEDSYF